jgi:proline iminopeptidase
VGLFFIHWYFFMFPRQSAIENILFPSISPFNEGMLKVSEVHSIWYAQYGAPLGIPVIIVHGGPGAGCGINDMRYFDPNFYHIILFDQRGAKRSIPTGNLHENTIQDLISDMEQLRKTLGIEKWLLFGGSWGTALSIAYGEAYAKRCLGFILRGIFLVREQDIHQLWYGMQNHFPEVWNDFYHFLPENERKNLIASYCERFLHSEHEKVALPAIRAFAHYDFTCSFLEKDPTYVAKLIEDDSFILSLGRIFGHYSINNFFLENNQLLKNLDRIKHLPATIVHGRYDMICLAKAAFELHEKWPNSKLVLTEQAGHAAIEPNTTQALVNATEEMRTLLQ